MEQRILILYLMVCSIEIVSSALPPTCDSRIYCHGPLLHTIQMAKIFRDSKTFVDMKIRTSEEEILSNFQRFMNKTQQRPKVEQVRNFVRDNFEDGNELEVWDPPDFNPEPRFLKKIVDAKLQEICHEIVYLWKSLARKTSKDVAENPFKYSILALPNGFIIPGGRFKEIYYWDTYWIIRGLLISGMNHTARGMVENLLYLAKTLGHVPNGSRIYYVRRSHPPLLTKMVWEYVNYTQDYRWLAENIHILENEMMFWIKHRPIWVRRDGINYRMFHYYAPSAGPRPESYSEDVETASHFQDKQRVYTELKSGAESGWDFSSRWFFDTDGGNTGNLSDIQTSRVIPVDLNVFVHDSFFLLAHFFKILGDNRRQQLWEGQAKQLEFGIINVLWNDTIGIWLDYDYVLGKHRNYFYMSNLTPLITACCLHQKFRTVTKKIINYLKTNNVTEYLGGVPTSLRESGEQWDYPNAWAPLVSMLVFGLMKTKNKDAENLAFKLAQNWVRGNYIVYSKKKQMYEKYHAVRPGKRGGGGEYEVQSGFGWTNGVILLFLKLFKYKLRAS